MKAERKVVYADAQGEVSHFVECLPAEDIVHLSMGGEIDAAVAEWILAGLKMLSFDPFGKLRFVVIDVSDVSFIDSSGLRTLISFYKHLQEISGDVWITEASDEDVVGRLLTITGQAERFHYGRDIEVAIKEATAKARLE